VLRAIRQPRRLGIPVGTVDIGFEHPFEIGDVVDGSVIEDLVGGDADPSPGDRIHSLVKDRRR
jgi:hypothetical protein